MDLIGCFDNCSNGHWYALITGYIICVHLKTEVAIEMVQAYVEEVYAKCEGSPKSLSDNGTEFRNQLFIDIGP